MVRYIRARPSNIGLNHFNTHEYHPQDSLRHPDRQYNRGPAGVLLWGCDLDVGDLAYVFEHILDLTHSLEEVRVHV